MKRNSNFFTPTLHGSAESRGIFYPRDSSDPTFYEKQQSTRVPSSFNTRHDAVKNSVSLRKSSWRQHSSSSSTISREPVPDTGTGSILLVSITPATSLHPHAELVEYFLVTIQQHFCNPRSISAPVIFRYTRPTISHSTYQFNTGNTNRTT